MIDDIAIGAVKDILNADYSDQEKAEKIVSQMFWHPGPDDKETWQAVVGLVVSQHTARLAAVQTALDEAREALMSIAHGSCDNDGRGCSNEDKAYEWLDSHPAALVESDGS